MKKSERTRAIADIKERMEKIEKEANTIDWWILSNANSADKKIFDEKCRERDHKRNKIEELRQQRKDLIMRRPYKTYATIHQYPKQLRK